MYGIHLLQYNASTHIMCTGYDVLYMHIINPFNLTWTWARFRRFLMFEGFGLFQATMVEKARKRGAGQGAPEF